MKNTPGTSLALAKRTRRNYLLCLLSNLVPVHLGLRKFVAVDVANGFLIFGDWLTEPVLNGCGGQI
jgi:hypothetical protein